MRSNSHSIWPVCLLILAALLVGCSDDDPLVDTGGSTEVTVKYLSSAPDTADIINDPVWDDVDQASVRTGLDPLYTDQFGKKIVRTQAVSDGEYVYFKFTWSDETESDRPGYWTHLPCEDCPPPYDLVWTQNWEQLTDSTGIEMVNALNPRWEKEDILALILDNGSNGSEGAKCATMCHTSGSQTDTMYLTGGGQVDVWIWRAGRTAPLGLADDMFWETGMDLVFDASAVNVWVRNARSATSERSEPKWRHVDGADYRGSYLFASDTATLDLADTNVVWESGDGVPGYVLTRDWKPNPFAAVSRYDVESRSEFDPQANSWTVVLWRKLSTGNSDDFDLVAGEEYKFTLAIMDHTDNYHSGSAVMTIQF